jgi:hypothetical protein
VVVTVPTIGCCASVGVLLVYCQNQRGLSIMSVLC